MHKLCRSTKPCAQRCADAEPRAEVDFRSQQELQAQHDRNTDSGNDDVKPGETVVVGFQGRHFLGHAKSSITKLSSLLASTRCALDVVLPGLRISRLRSDPEAGTFAFEQ